MKKLFTITKLKRCEIYIPQLLMSDTIISTMAAKVTNFNQSRLIYLTFKEEI